MKKLFALSLMTGIMTFNMAHAVGTGMIIKLTVQEETIFQRDHLNEDLYEKIGSNGKADYEVNVRLDNKTLSNLSGEEILPNANRFSSITLLSDDLIKFVDDEAGVNSTAAADITRESSETGFKTKGRISEITVKSKDYQTLYADQLNKSGINMIKHLRLGAGKISTDAQFSDLKCIADQDILRCKSTGVLRISINK